MLIDNKGINMRNRFLEDVIEERKGNPNSNSHESSSKNESGVHKFKEPDSLPQVPLDESIKHSELFHINAAKQVFNKNSLIHGKQIPNPIHSVRQIGNVNSIKSRMKERKSSYAVNLRSINQRQGSLQSSSGDEKRSD